MNERAEYALWKKDNVNCLSNELKYYFQNTWFYTEGIQMAFNALSKINNCNKIAGESLKLIHVFFNIEPEQS